MRVMVLLRWLLLAAFHGAAGALTPLLDSLHHYEYTWPQNVESFFDDNRGQEPQMHPDRLQFDVSAFNASFRVNLERNQDLFGSGYSHRYSLPNGTWHIEGELEHCYYHGTIVGDPSSVVAMSTCNGLRGFVAGFGMMLHLEPAHIHGTESAPEDPLRSQLIVFLAEHLQDSVRCRVTGDHDHDQDHEHDHDHDHDSGHNSGDHKHTAEHMFEEFLGKGGQRGVGGARELLDDSYRPKPLWVELYVVNDYARYEQRNKPGYSRTEDVINQMDALYRAGNFVPALRVRLVAQDTWASGNLIKYEGHPSNPREVSSPKLLTAFQRYRMENVATLPKHANAQLLSGVDFDGGASGLAVVGSMCQHATSCSVNQLTHALPLNAAITAHEMGHNFGMRHDSDGNACPESGFIMNAVMKMGETPDSWSSCSRKYLDEFLLRPSKYEGCLMTDEPLRGSSLPDTCGDGVLGPAEQCDCGSRDCSLIDPCCNGATCRFKSWA
jgi:disintegrin and metalloproteinase domain-containing protein 8